MICYSTAALRLGAVLLLLAMRNATNSECIFLISINHLFIPVFINITCVFDKSHFIS